MTSNVKEYLDNILKIKETEESIQSSRKRIEVEKKEHYYQDMLLGYTVFIFLFIVSPNITNVEFETYLFGSRLGDSLSFSVFIGIYSAIIFYYITRVSVWAENELGETYKVEYIIPSFIFIISSALLFLLDGANLFNFIAFYFVIIMTIGSLLMNLVLFAYFIQARMKKKSLNRNISQNELKVIDIENLDIQASLITDLNKRQSILERLIKDDKESLISLYSLQNSKILTKAQTYKIEDLLTDLKDEVEKTMRKNSFEDILNEKFSDNEIELENI